MQCRFLCIVLVSFSMFNCHSEVQQLFFMQGVPIRIELGPKDMKQKQVVAVRRDTGEKLTLQRDTAVNDILHLLETIHCNMLDK